jgi:RNA polymerase sigma-70 factor, ECF subfamily
LALRQDELTSLCDDVDLERDRVLVERCQAGDSAAFGNLYARYYDRLLRFCLRRLNDRHEAEDAAQEAFARAWKALPRFAGERRFYPWLTVIAGNICTDMLRRRSRSTPTDDMELTAQHPVGVVTEDTSEELVLAAVDGELVNRALNRLSTRHRHVLAMREESGWTYQQIADYEGVEIGTIETLLWRARQALKREFAVVSESKGALAGFLVATGAFFRRAFFRLAHRGAGVQHHSGGSGDGLRNAVAGVAVTGAAVAAALITPHALSSGPSSPPGAPGAALAAPQLVLGAPSASGAGAGGAAGAAAPTQPGDSAAGVLGGPAGGGSGSGTPNTSTQGGSAGAGGGGLGSLLGGTNSSSGGGAIRGGVAQTAGGLNGSLSGAANAVGGTVGGVVAGAGGAVKGAVGGLSGATAGAGATLNGATGGAASVLGSVTQTVNTQSSNLGLGNVLPQAPSGSGGGTSAGTGAAGSTGTTTPTTEPPLGGLNDTVGGLDDTVGGLLGN